MGDLLFRTAELQKPVRGFSHNTFSFEKVNILISLRAQEEFLERSGHDKEELVRAGSEKTQRTKSKVLVFFSKKQ